MSNNNPIKVSIIVPIYNAENKLRRCLDSLITQTLKDIEILLINDGSSDLSGEICQDYAQRFHNVHYYNQSNHGVSSTRNIGLREANGSYIMFCDSDDYYEIDAAETLYYETDGEKFDWVVAGVNKTIYSEMELVDAGSAVCLDQEAKQDILLEMTKNYMIKQLWGKLYRAEIIRCNGLKMREDMSCGEDFEWICRFVKHASKIKSIRRYVYHYIVENGDSLSQQFNRNYFKNIEYQFLSIKKLYLEEKMWIPYGEVVIAQQVHNIVSGYMKVGKDDCNLSFAEKKAFIREGIELKSRMECLKAKNERLGIKEILLRITNPTVLLIIATLCA